jgi:hypothetical protein
MLSAVINCPAAVVNDGQLTTNVPVAGLPFARYTVPWTVVVLTAAWAVLSQPMTATAINNNPTHLTVRNHS